MPDTPNGGGYPYNFERRMDRMEGFLQSMVGAMQEYHRLMTIRHEQTMEEIRELITLQREHRVDIMALVQASKENRARLEKLEGEKGQ